MRRIKYNVNNAMKNSYLIIIVAILLLGRKQDGIKKILSSVSVEDALSLLKLTGIDENLINNAMEILPDLTSGADPVALIKKALPLILSLTNNQNNASDDSQNNYAGTAPVDDFIPDEVKRDLADYFA